MTGPTIETSTVDTWTCVICGEIAVARVGMVRPKTYCRLHMPVGLGFVAVDYEVARDEAGLNDELYARRRVPERPFPDMDEEAAG